MKKFYFLFLVSSSLHFYSQEVIWQRDIPSITQDFLSGLTTTLDRQFLVSGSSIQTSKITGVVSDKSSTSNNGYDYHVVKLNQQGKIAWEKYYVGNHHDFLTATTSTQEGGFLIAGTSFSGIGADKKSQNYGGSDVWMIKLSESGEEEWQTSVGTDYDEEAKTVIQSSDLGYFMGGSIQAPQKGFGSKDAWIVKLDKTGKIINQMIFGGNGLEEIEQMIPTRDGGALVAVYSRSDDASSIEQAVRERYQLQIKEEQEMTKNESALAHNSKTVENLKLTKYDTDFNKIPTQHYAKKGEHYGEGDYWIMKLDKEGRLQWQKNLGGKEDDRIKTLSITENGYLIGGESRSSGSGSKQESIKEGTDIWLVELDENGNEEWQKSYSFGNRDVLMSQSTIWDAENIKAKGFLLGGYTQAEEKKNGKDETFWILYIDSKGEEVWKKYIDGKSRKEQERLVAANLNNDGTYILAGTSAEELGRENWKIVMLGDKQVQELIEKKDIRIYPNPVADYCYVEIGVEFKEATISIYDMSGRQIQQVTTKNAVTKLNTSSLPQGVYLVNAKTEKNSYNVKIIK